MSANLLFKVGQRARGVMSTCDCCGRGPADWPAADGKLYAWITTRPEYAGRAGYRNARVLLTERGYVHKCHLGRVEETHKWNSPHYGVTFYGSDGTRIESATEQTYRYRGLWVLTDSARAKLAEVAEREAAAERAVQATAPVETPRSVLSIEPVTFTRDLMF